MVGEAKMGVHVRFGSLADMAPAYCDVCLTPESGHDRQPIDVR